MSSIPETVTSKILSVAPAANADELSEAQAPQVLDTTETASGWDAYEVWRRFIKDARDRRHHASSEPKG